MDFLPTSEKLHCSLIFCSNATCPYAYVKSNVVKYTFPDFFSAIIWLTPSINSSIFGIWYLFLCTCLFNSLDSSANFMLPSFFTVMTIGETKYLSEHSCHFEIYPSFISRWISLSTFSCRLIGTLRPFCCIGFKFSKNSALTFAFRIFPILVNKFGYNLQKYVCNSSYSSSS